MAQEILSVVTRKGQITIPATIRRSLGIKEGDRVAFSLSESDTGTAQLRPVHSVAKATYGAVKSPGGPADLEALRRQFEEDVAEEVARELGGEAT